jgi:hypothetical protein
MWKGVLLYAVIYCALFIGHIIAAARNLDLLFRVIVTLVTLMTLLVGLSTYLLCQLFKETNGIVVGRFACVPLSAGIGWAYAGMEFSPFISIWVIAAIIIQLFTERGLINYIMLDGLDG